MLTFAELLTHSDPNLRNISRIGSDKKWHIISEKIEQKQPFNLPYYLQFSTIDFIILLGLGDFFEEKSFWCILIKSTEKPDWEDVKHLKEITEVLDFLESLT